MSRRLTYSLYALALVLAPIIFVIARDLLAAPSPPSRHLTIYATTDASEAAPLLAAFRRHHPTLAIAYIDINAADLDARFRREVAGGGSPADLIWSVAMDLQIKLVNDNLAQPYVSAQRAALPSWAIWKDQAWGITAEPVVIAYNRRLLPIADVPRSHGDLVRLLTGPAAEALRDKVVTYDPLHSAAGYLLISQDMEASPDGRRAIEALGVHGLATVLTSKEMLDRLSSGRATIAYNLIGSYALERQATDPSIGIVLPTDYTLVTSRIAIIPRGAPHVDAARAFVDFLLSREGQALLAKRFMGPVRSDVSVPRGIWTDRARAIRVGPALLVGRDQLKRRRFAAAWTERLAAGATASAR